MKTIIRTLAVALTLGVVATLASAAAASDFGGYGGGNGNWNGGHNNHNNHNTYPHFEPSYPQHYEPSYPQHFEPSYPRPSYPQWNGNVQTSGKQFKQNFTPSQYSQPKKTKKGRFSQSVPYGY